MKVEEENLKFNKDSSFELKADMVIKALGFDPEDLPTLFDSKRTTSNKVGNYKN